MSCGWGFGVVDPADVHVAVGVGVGLEVGPGGGVGLEGGFEVGGEAFFFYVGIRFVPGAVFFCVFDGGEACVCHFSLGDHAFGCVFVDLGPDAGWFSGCVSEDEAVVVESFEFAVDPAVADGVLDGFEVADAVVVVGFFVVDEPDLGFGVVVVVEPGAPVSSGFKEKGGGRVRVGHGGGVVRCGSRFGR